MARKPKKIPVFKSESEEKKFWSKHDSTEFLDWSQAKKVTFAKLKPSVRTISLRLPEAMLEAMKSLANRMDVPYQSLMKTFLAERIKKEQNKEDLKPIQKTSKVRRRA